MTTEWYDWNGVNLSLFRVINRQNPGNWYDPLMTLGTELGSHVHFVHYLCIIMVCMLWSVAKRADPAAVSRGWVLRWVSVAAVLPIAYTIEGWWLTWLKDYFAYQRPYAALAEGSLRYLGDKLAPAEAARSFPSGHAAFAMLMAAGLWPVVQAPGKWLLAVFVVWVGWSRLALGVHFPADVLAGYVLSLVTVVAVRVVLVIVADSASRKGKPAPDRPIYH